jgi:cellobiose phosphorylase
VYNAQAHVGRGGWTWYTGSSSWSYRAALEAILGFHLRGDRLTISPCIPKGWRQYEIDYRFGSSLYAIRVENPDGVSTGVASVEVDDQPSADGAIGLVDDGARHEVLVIMGATRTAVPFPANAHQTSNSPSRVVPSWPPSSSEITGSSG